ncbi:Pirin [Catenovulum agarivorans DS-2]|uniref:Pirin n=1 Tax=Catenovulum agarivorans DS-2 TaxID=1328313 RepID=W7QN61_9ALTE|nr:pirin family protein [Catenovulum agarivorans]EWH09333.1 Pirin [Catenovulum agarivorans DS-2]
MISVRKSSERGKASFGWLDSRHTFSFGHYYDPKHMGFSALRVINDDVVKPAAGFDTHGHKDMEIISYVLQGSIQHKDSAGNVQTLPAGEFQLMSAGKGILHSEYNASATEDLRFLQIWIEPNTFGGEPDYQQKDFGQQLGLTTIVTPDGQDGSLKIKQDAKLHQLILQPDQNFQFQSTLARKIYVHIVNGKLGLAGITLSQGDGGKVTGESKLDFTNHHNANATALIFELP